MEQTVQKALNLLEALVRSDQPRRLTELSRELGLTKPNVYRLLSTLSDPGLREEGSGDEPVFAHAQALGDGLDAGSRRGPAVGGRAAPAHASARRRASRCSSPCSMPATWSTSTRWTAPSRSRPSPASARACPATVVSTGKAMLAWLPARGARPRLRAREALHAAHDDAAQGHRARPRGDARARLRGESRRVPRGRVRHRARRCATAAGTWWRPIGVWGSEKSILGTRREELAHMTVAAARDISREMGFVERADAGAPRARDRARLVVFASSASTSARLRRGAPALRRASRRAAPRTMRATMIAPERRAARTAPSTAAPSSP